MSRFFEKLVCIILAIMSGFTFLTNGLKAFAASSFSSSPVYGLLADGTVDSILGQLKSVTSADDVVGAVYNPYGTILDYAQDALELQESSKLLVDTNSYNTTSGFWDIAYGVLATGELVRVMCEAGEYVYDFVESALDVEVSGETFSEICDRLALQYAPDARTDYVSWQDNNHVASTRAGLLWRYGDGLITGTSTVYMKPFARDSTGALYFSPGLFCASVSDSILTYTYLPNEFTVTDITDASNWYTEGTVDLSKIYALNAFFDYECIIQVFQTYERYLGDSQNTSLPPDYAVRKYRSSSDVTKTKEFPYDSAVTSAPVAGDLRDWGFYFSSEPIEMTGLIDPIPVEHLEDTTVTLAGDTIYDYTITNNTTGDTSTVNYFVTNNYTYENSGGSSGDSGSSDGGSTSGDVNVGGKVDVSGDIEVGGKVDININVEQQGSGSESDSASSMPVDVDLNNYFEIAPEQAKPVTDFLEVFFDFLPPELLALICLGVVVAIMLRIWGR